mmetsp:Transcript_8002/g.17401  ORF Transcript_8002/g.17401 Transcript_8002/m.17401 type:complete len:94 (+) Transcript_8002:878-1159(+)
MFFTQNAALRNFPGCAHALFFLYVLTLKEIFLLITDSANIKAHSKLQQQLQQASQPTASATACSATKTKSSSLFCFDHQDARIKIFPPGSYFF